MSFYTNPASMAPLTPEIDGPLQELAQQVGSFANQLAGRLHPFTATAIASFLRPVNSYYSNLIEGHPTSPIAIEQALKKEYSTDRRQRNLQHEAEAHIQTQVRMQQRLAAASEKINPYEPVFWQWLHQEFYEHLPVDFQQATSKSGELLSVVPGHLRTIEVEVGRHQAPAAAALPGFTELFAWHYNPQRTTNQVLRTVQAAAAHHRFVWIHPFLDGNGRVGRLLSEAAFQVEGLGAHGLWAISRGLARRKEEYRAQLASADRLRRNDYDGRGNLSEKALRDFCWFFLDTALDQLRYMMQALDTDTMLARLLTLADLLTAQRKLPKEARYVLQEVFLRGQVSRRELPRLVGKSENTARALAETLIGQGLLTTGNRFAPYQAAYPVGFSPVLFPGMYPTGDEVDMMQRIQS